MQIDGKDRAILNILQAHGKITNKQLAEEVNLSPASTLERVRKLEQNKIIKSYHAYIAYDQLSLPIHILATVRLHQLTKENLSLFKNVVTTIPAIITCEQVIGAGVDFFLRVITSDISTYHNMLIEQLYPLLIISEIQTFLITDTMKQITRLL